MSENLFLLNPLNMSILSDNDNSSKQVSGCGGKIIRKTESFVKRKSRKLPTRSNPSLSNYICEQNEKPITVMPQKTYIFWILILIIFFMAMVNFLILIIMMNVLRIGEGMESMEMLSNDEVIKFYGDTDLDDVLYEGETVKGFQNIPLKIVGSDASFVMMSLKNRDSEIAMNKMKIDADEISFLDVDRFDVFDPVTWKNVFSTDYKEFKIPKGLSRLDVKKLRVSRMISPRNSNLTIKSDAVTRLRGSEGIRIRGKEITFSADGDIYLNSVQGVTYLSADKVFARKTPIVETKSNIGRSWSQSQYKLCVCMPQGQFFKIRIPSNIESHLACDYVDLSTEQSPCVSG